MVDFLNSNARDLARLVREGSIDPKTLLDFHISRVEDLNEDVFALRAFDAKKPREDCEELKKRLHSDARGSRLAGIPFSVKDHINVIGLPRSEGTKQHAEESCSSTASVVQRFFDEGAICLGKANMSEYGKSYTTDNIDFGRTSNPFNLEYSPGGSSGGDAAAVASGMVQFGIGADSGGSVRVPANFCGCFGLSPTSGRISNAGLTEFSHSVRTIFRNIGVFARSIHDLELITEIACGFDPLDPHSCSLPNSLVLESVKFSLNDLKRKFVCFDEIDGISCDSEIAEALKEASARFEKMGLQAQRQTPDFVKSCFEPFIILSVQAGLRSEDIAAELRGTPRDPEVEGPGLKFLRQRLGEELPELSADSVLRYWFEVDKLRNEAAAAFQNYDFILCPVSATLPVKHGTHEYEVGGKKLQNQEVFRFSSVPNVLGLPAVAFPTGLSREGLPVGLQIIGPRFSERRLIQLVREAGFERALSPKPL